MEIGYVLIDGCADRPNPRLNFTTPLEAAYTPNLDRLAAGGRLGRVTTVGRGISPESDIAVFNMLGYSFEGGYPGRGVVEAVGAGVDFRDGQLALRANFASVKGRVIVDRRAGRNITLEEAKGLEEELAQIHLDGASFEFRSTVAYRGVLVIRADEPLSASVSNTDPAYSRVKGFGTAREIRAGESVQRCHAESRERGAKRAAALVNEFTDKALKLLARSGVNRKRVLKGKAPANSVLVRDAGDHLPRVVSFAAKYGRKGVALVDMPVEVGIAKLLGMEILPTERNDISAKGELFLKELDDGSVVYAHLKGPDEFGHDGDAVGKKGSVELIDRDFFSRLRDTDSDTRIAVSCDHATPCTLKMHSADPVPLLITHTTSGDGFRFTEANSRKGSLHGLRGRDVLRTILALQ